jgi:hypothetical protein
MYEPITVNVDRVDRGQGDGAYSSTPISFAGRLLRTVEGDHTAMRLYEWADRGRLAYLVHVEEDRPGRPPPAHPLPVRQHPLGRVHPHEGLHRRGGFSGLPGVGRWEVRAAAAWRGILETSALPFAPIHPSAWKGCSPKFAPGFGRWHHAHR